MNTQETRLQRPFFARPAESLAPALIGKVLIRVLPDGSRLAGLIVETEAYVGVHDRASHAFNGRRTDRNESMYARAGTAYVYFTYGMHHCFNIVCGETEQPVAVLVRALEPLLGQETMREHRVSYRVRRSALLETTDLCSGPGKLCCALAIDRGFDRADLTMSPSLYLAEADAKRIPERDVAVSPRIGIGSAGDWAHKPLRWSVRNNPHVSVPVPNTRIRSGAQPVHPNADRPGNKGKTGNRVQHSPNDSKS